MPTTFKAVVYAFNKRKDGTYNVKIRVTHRRQFLKVSTNMYAALHQLTRALKIKDQGIIDETNRIITNWRNIVGRLGSAADVMTVRQVVDYIKTEEQNSMAFQLDFIAYGRKIAATMREGTAKGYFTALNALVRFIGTETLDIGRINARFLESFEQFIETEPVLTHNKKRTVNQLHKSKKGGRAVSSYLACIRHIHNRAKQEFNDEESGVIRIPQSPFKKYRVKQPPKVKKRAIGTDLIQQIVDLDDEPRRVGSISEFTRRDLARDCFLLSFGLAGMNAADLLSCPAQSLAEDVIVYNRQKTASRREDEAEMHIRIEPQIAPLVEKYRDPRGERLFRFHRHYRDGNTFNCALNQGLKRIDAALRAAREDERLRQDTPDEEQPLPEHITFYAARHSWATIARSAALNIDKYTVHEALNHVDEDMKITDRYIDRDWSVIWQANAAVIGLLDWSALQKREEKRK
ncbi:phage integrase SAM-like domain-containing protein [Alistipes sp.]|uniref:phage integrase SAM-like domain-containing protein n=1 Tax=Alistipes sp. TaxID=1872444 RepID=UPI003AF11D1D